MLTAGGRNVATGWKPGRAGFAGIGGDCKAIGDVIAEVWGKEWAKEWESVGAMRLADVFWPAKTAGPSKTAEAIVGFFAPPEYAASQIRRCF